MNITVYVNNSPANFVNKSIAQVASLNGVLRKPTSIVDPVIQIDRDIPTGFNYVYIPEFKRYYFVTGISSETTHLVSVALHVDVLMTYKAAIGQATAIVKRQEKKWNLYLDDGLFRSYQYTNHKLMKFPAGFDNFSYVLALAGNAE